MEFTEVIKNRFSCKAFDGRPVDGEALQAILEVGRLAPTAKNQQEQKIYVIQSQDGLAKIDKLTPCRYGASTVLLVAYDTDHVYTYPGGVYQSGTEDAAIVATHMMLGAANYGVDSCWINNFDPDAAAALFELSPNEKVLMLLDLGYRAATTKPLPNHFSRKELAETVQYR